MDGMAVFTLRGRLLLLRRLPKHAPILAALALAALTPGCASLGVGKNAKLAEERANLLGEAQAKAVLLEAKIADLQRDNTRLTKRVNDLEGSIKSAQAQAVNAANAVKSAELASAESAVRAAAADQKAVAASAQPDRAITASPVKAAPRLVQPSFASQEKTVFENEAKGGDIRLASVLFGVHLASYRHNADAVAGWRTLQRQYPSELSLLEPRVAPVTLEGRGAFVRLIAGGFSTQQTAAALCETLIKRGRFCEVASFDGEKLSD